MEQALQLLGLSVNFVFMSRQRQINPHVVTAVESFAVREVLATWLVTLF